MDYSSNGLSKNRGTINKRNTFDWMADIPVAPGEKYKIVEVSFKKGARKDFFHNDKALDLRKGDKVVVETKQGFDIGEVCLSGEIVRLQMKKKKKINDDSILKIQRKASLEEVYYLKTLRSKEKAIMIQARAIAKKSDLKMKISEVEYQGDGRKATFYFLSNGRIDFRELVKEYSQEFKIKIEMRQIGARQEAQRLGGVTSYGREYCGSSFVNEFKTVSIKDAIIQQLSPNSDKLLDICGKLKYCLTYELDTYIEANKKIPKRADKLKTKEGVAYLRKTDIFKMEMTYNINKNNKYYKLSVDDVKEVLQMNKKGEIPESLANFNIIEEPKEKEKLYDDLVGQVKLNSLNKKSKSSKKRNKNKQKRNKNKQRRNQSNRDRN